MTLLDSNHTPKTICAITILLLNFNTFATENSTYFSVGAYSDYIARGYTQTDSHPSLQISLDLVQNDLGTYIGLWTTNIEESVYVGANQETDFYIGWNYPLSEQWTINTEAIRYHYFGVKNRLANTDEYRIALSNHSDLSNITGSINYSPNSYGLGSFHYTQLQAEINLSEQTMLEFRYGWNLYNRSPADGGFKDYGDWSVGY